MSKPYVKSLPIGEQEVKAWDDAAPIIEFKDTIRNGKVRGSLEVLICENNLVTVGDLRNLPARVVLRTPSLGHKTANELKRLLGGNLKPPSYFDKQFVSRRII